MKPYRLLILLFFSMLLIPAIVYCQDDDGEEIKMSQEEWHLQRDQYAVTAIKLLERIEKLDSLIDSLKTVKMESDKIISNCDEDLFALVGATKEQVADFRKLFETTERDILNYKGTYPEWLKSFSGLSDSKIVCLPEFNTRFNSLKKKLQSFVFTNTDTIKTTGTYTVVKGDNLSKIAKLKYGNRKYWSAIWEANKNDIIKENLLTEPYDKIYFNPNFIYPGQVLKIPVLTDEQIDLSKKKRKHNN